MQEYKHVIIISVTQLYITQETKVTVLMDVRNKS